MLLFRGQPRSARSFLIVLGWLSFFASARSEWAAQLSRRDAIKDSFQYNYAKYEKYAFGLDLLRPVSKTGTDDNILAGFGGTIVDSMSTMLVMGMGDSPEYHRALKHVRSLDLRNCTTGNPPGTVSLFELTIRYLGGLLSAYDLGGKKREHQFLVDKAAELADLLSRGWRDGSKLPHNDVFIAKHKSNETKSPYDLGFDWTRSTGSDRSTLTAQAGTMVLEWGALSYYTGNSTYKQLAEDAMDMIVDSKPIFPGLWAQELWAKNGSAKGDTVTWGGVTDSMLEYLPKYPFFLGQDQHRYLKAFKQTIESTIAHLAVKTGVFNLTFPADYSVSRYGGLSYFHSHLACFGAGNVAFGGRLFERDDWVQFGLEWAESCAHTYRATATGIGPMAWRFLDKEGHQPGDFYVSPIQRPFYDKHGFYITMSSWNHQPEVIESIFYAWRITGQEFWRDMAWDMFLNMRLECDTGDGGWAGLHDVNAPSGGINDQTQTFLFAELFKYLYLIFDDPERFSLDEYVFNTEAHPQRRHPGGNFPRIQGTHFPYRRVVTNDSIALSGGASNESAARPAGLSELQDEPKRPTEGKWRFVVFSFRLGSGSCSSSEAGNRYYDSTATLGDRVGRILHCHAQTLLLLPFASVAVYWIISRTRSRLNRRRRRMMRKADSP